MLKMSTNRKNVLTWTKNVLRQLLIFTILVFTLWNCAKVPYYIGFDANGDTNYEKGGLTSSINLHFWVKGFQSVKLHSPACNFLLVHIALGSTVLIMMVLSLINDTWRKRYGFYYFAFTILFGVHAIPAAWTTQYAANTRYASSWGIMVFVCIMVIAAALLGFYTLKTYDTNPIVAEKRLLIAYSVITFGSLAAGGAEAREIAFAFVYKMKNGVYKDYLTTPDPLFGHSVYDLIPETFGLSFFCAFTTIVWFWWPIKILQDNADETRLDAEEENETAHLLSQDP